MAPAKELKLGFSLDQGSFDKVKRALDEITTSLQKVSKASQGLSGIFGGTQVGANTGSGGGGGPRTQAQTQQQRVGVGSSILKDAEAFKTLSRSGGDAMTAMSASIKKAIREQMVEVSRLDSVIDKLGAKFKTLDSKGQVGMSQAMLKVAGLRNRAAAGLNQLDALNPDQMQGPRDDTPAPVAAARKIGLLSPVFGKAGIFGAGAAAGAAAGGGGGGTGGANITAAGLLTNPLGTLGQLLSSTNPLLVAARSASMIGAGAMGVMGMSQGFNNGMLDLSAQRGQLMNPMLGRIKRADISDFMKQKELASYSRDDKIEVLRRSGSFDQNALDTIKAGASDAATFVKSALGSGGATLASSDISRDNTRMERMLDAQEKIGQTGAYQLERGRALEYMNETASSRMQSSRIQGRGFYKKKDGSVDNRFSDWAADLHERGYSPEASNAAVAQSRLSGGRRFAGLNSDTVMAADAAGYGGYGSMAGLASRLGGSKAAAGMALSAMGGRIDTGAGIDLGNLLFQYNGRGNTNGMGALGAIQNGMGFTGDGQDFNLVQRAALGLQTGTSITTGGMDSYQQGRNLLTAIGLNPGGSTRSQDFLANGMDMKQMLDMASGSSPLTATARAMGLDKGMIKEQLSGSMSSVLDRFVDQGSNDPMAKTIRKYRESGKSIDAFLKTASVSETEDIGAFYGQESGMGEEGGLGLAYTLRGSGGKARKGKAPAGGLDEATKAELKAQADQMRESAKQFNTFFTELLEGLQKNKDVGKTMGDFSKLATNAEHAADSLAKLAGVSDEIIAQGKGSTTATALGVTGNKLSGGMKAGKKGPTELQPGTGKVF